MFMQPLVCCEAAWFNFAHYWIFWGLKYLEIRILANTRPWPSQQPQIINSELLPSFSKPQKIKIVCCWFCFEIMRQGGGVIAKAPQTLALQLVQRQRSRILNSWVPWEYIQGIAIEIRDCSWISKPPLIQLILLGKTSSIWVGFYILFYSPWLR